ncbi:protein DpdJ [Paenibacillus polymyxa]|uniref:protein DpdJ n=1 Tax=Paenibacillus polymyxa TaxID=1406 RepID=UPI0008FC97F9|nr:protein DpdJ [Paenibacillus polymyxa]
MDWKQLFLNELEAEEAKYLSWGYVEGYFTDEELTSLAESFIERHEIHDFSAEELINALLEDLHISMLPSRDGEVWRTRMAETVRLIARLRQWFPTKAWQSSPTLVADFRFQEKIRIYPKRNINSQALIDTTKGLLNSLEADVLRYFLEGKGSTYKLSDFQQEAAIQMFKDLQDEQSRGFIVTSGTGTGKTLSFYLPALTWIAARIDKTNWTKAVALYPRNELLKDQFMDTFKEVLELNKMKSLERPISIGAVFGDTPTNQNQVKSKWKMTSQGYVCPFLKCPGCKSDLIWSKSDHDSNLERLICLKRECNTVIEGEVLPLTRNKMLRNPPDILFTTTEMMNRYMSDQKYGSLIGIGTSQSPRIVLLDEVHTYTGTHGAQVALLLRRWQHVLGGVPLQFVGLSATLRDSGDFFSQLTGLARTKVAEVDSSYGEPEEKGKEYQLLLRGDPASGTSLLSTTIQTAMLLRRMLDRTPSDGNGTTYGSKLFLFTDDLDVTNRLFHTLLDAEARDTNQKNYPKKLDRDPLAALRSHNNDEAKQRMQNGQSWLFAEDIGHDLVQSLIVGRTSSQDTGVDQKAEVIIASPSLEVGFNDKLVGAVIQHKAPRDLASFVQRKGRAGRDPDMRPWMVTVLSDFGRDRYMYQSYETLFQPVLERQELPIMNRYVLRIQAVFAFMDWIAYELRHKKFIVGSLWQMFAQPLDHSYPDQYQKLLRGETRKLIKKVIDDSSIRGRMETYIRKALSITQQDVRAILWDPPRSLMLEVLPTLLRRLETNWGVVGDSRAKETHISNHPLPEFVPSTLFSELSLPEVSIVLPSDKVEDQSMDILQALNTFAPGRVSRRFGIDHSRESHWIAPPTLKPSETGESSELMISTFCNEDEYRILGLFSYINKDGSVVELPVIRPWKLKPAQSNFNVDTKSNAHLVWKSQIFPSVQAFIENEEKIISDDGEYGRDVEVPTGLYWSSLLKDIRFFTHDTFSAVTVRRFAIGSEASVRLVTQSDPVQLSIRFGLEPGKSAALGFVQQVDGIRFELMNVPDTIISSADLNTAKLRSFRTMYFQYSVMNDPCLMEQGNMFVLERMAEIYLSALLQIALINDLSLTEACDHIHSNDFPKIMNNVMHVIFQVLEKEEISDIEEEAHYQRTHLKLKAMFEIPLIGERLKSLAVILWSEETEDWNNWAKKRWIATLGEAILAACLEIAGPHRNGELLLDIGGGPQRQEDGSWLDKDQEIWVTETIEGGSGIIEEIIKQYQRDPRRFFRLIESSLTPSDAEIVHSELSRIIKETQINEELQSQLYEFRNANGYKETTKAVEGIKKVMERSGILVTHPVMNGLFNRLLRPGSNQQTDCFMFELLQLWEREESRLGIEMDARVFAYVSSVDSGKSANLISALDHIDPRASDDVNWRFNVIYGMIWPRGSQIRRRALESYNPFKSPVPTDRELLLNTVKLHKHVEYCTPNWRDLMIESLISYGSVQLLVPQDNKLEINDIILSLTAAPLDLGFLHSYPRVEGITRDNGMFIIHFEIREALL